MRLIKIGLGNVNSTVGAFAANTDRCIEQARGMAAAGVTVGLFPEQVIGGYPPEDLIQWQGFVDNQWYELERFAAATAELPAVFVLGVAVAFEGLRYNCAAVVSGGQIDGLVPKEKLPTYSIYYEGRTVAHGSANLEDEHRGVPFGDYIFRYDFGTIAVEVCEDIWSPGRTDEAADLRRRGAGLQHLGVGLPDRYPRDPARADRDAGGRSPVRGRLRQSGRRE